MPSVSVVIPTHNRSALLPRAVESVLGQKRPADEVIVVDDGSTDGTAALVGERYPGVQLIEQANRGVSAARNRGIAAARGEWVAFLDSDDAWMAEKLARQMEAVEAAPGSVLCHTEEIWIRSGRRVNPMKKHAKSGGWIFEKCLPLCAISPSSAMVRRSLLLEIGGFDEELPACEDYDLWLRICARHPALFVDEALVVKHGGHADQLSRRHWGMDRFRVRAIEKLLEGSELTDAQRAAALRTMAGKLDVLAQGAGKRGKQAEAAAYAAKRKQAEEALRRLGVVL